MLERQKLLAGRNMEAKTWQEIVMEGKVIDRDIEPLARQLLQIYYPTTNDNLSCTVSWESLLASEGFKFRRMAEIGFKAGIQEAVNWVETHYFMMQGGKLEIDMYEWQAKIKEWKINES